MKQLGIFISYRREDTAAEALSIAQYLAKSLGEERVFLDIEKLRPGETFPHVLRQAIQKSRVMLVIVGHNWLQGKGGDSGSGSRLDDPNDWVRLEIETAMADGLVIIPVLVSGATLPSPHRLPETLQPLLENHAVTITTNGFRNDMAGLAADIGNLIPRRGISRDLVSIVAVLLMIGAGYLAFYVTHSKDGSEVSAVDGSPDRKLQTSYSLGPEDFEFLAWEIWADGFEQLAPKSNFWLLGSSLLLRQKRDGDVSSCRIAMEPRLSGIGEDFTLATDLQDYVNCAGTNNHGGECMQVAWKKHRSRMMFYEPGELTEGHFAGTKNIKVIYITDVKRDDEVCFRLYCERFELPKKCFIQKNSG